MDELQKDVLLLDWCPDILNFFVFGKSFCSLQRFASTKKTELRYSAWFHLPCLKLKMNCTCPTADDCQSFPVKNPQIKGKDTAFK